MGDDLSTIASGPTHFDHTSFQDCKKIIDKYGIWDKLSKGYLFLISILYL